MRIAAATGVLAALGLTTQTITPTAPTVGTATTSATGTVGSGPVDATFEGRSAEWWAKRARDAVMHR